MPPLTAKQLPKIGKKEEKLGRKGKNQEVFFTLPLLTDRAGYATALSMMTKRDQFTPFELLVVKSCKIMFDNPPHNTSKGNINFLNKISFNLLKKWMFLTIIVCDI